MESARLLAAWPFASPLMLGWMAVAIAPIVIHLLSKRKYREETWAAMRFLAAAMQKNSRRIRLEQWILLALRTLILLLLAAALAEPIAGTLLRGGEGFRGGVTHWVFVLDASYSMAYRSGDETAFEEAKRQAAKIASDAAQGDGFTLILMGPSPTAIIREPAFAASDLARELEVLAPRHGGAALEPTLAEVQALLDDAGENHPRLQENKVLIFSDLGRNTWEAAENEAVRKRLADLAENAELRLFDVGRDGRTNAAITSLKITEPLLTPQRDVQFRAELRKFSGPESRRRVEFLVDGRRVAEQTVSLSADDSASATFAHRFTEVGPHVVEVRAEGDPLPLDDHRWLTFQVRDAVRVLCIAGQPDAARFVALALAPEQDDLPSIRPEIAPESALLERELSQYECVFLCNVARIGPEDARVLRDYVRQGGAAVIFLGDQVQPASYNRWLGLEADGGALLPARIGDTRQDAAQYGFNPLEYRHPLVEPFRGHEQAGLLTTPVWKYFQLTPYEPLGAKVALGLDGGDPALVEAPIGRGRVILAALPASTASQTDGPNPTPWTAWPAWPSFPPMIQEMLRLAVSDSLDERNLQVGEPLIAAGVTTEQGDTVTLNGPGAPGQENWSERIPMSLDGDRYRWSFAQTDWAGLYRARYDGDEIEHLFAVNIDSQESDLTRIAPTVLPSQLQLSESAPERRQSPLTDDGRQPYFRHLLTLAAACLVLESLLAWYFGNSN